MATLKSIEYRSYIQMTFQYFLSKRGWLFKIDLNFPIRVVLQSVDT